MFSLIGLFTLLAVIVESSCKYTYPKGLPCKVYNTTILDCSNRKLTSIPPLKDHTVKTLNLSYNELKTVNGKSFIHLTSLQELYLSYNELETVNGKSFIHLTSLQELYLSLNSLSNINFDTSLSLLVLDLSFNKILNIFNDTFTGLNKLEMLDLSYQNSLMLHGSPFYSTTSLKKLDIVNSGLSGLPPSVFSGLHELQELDISYNSISNLLPATLFAWSTSLKYLNLALNYISLLPETLFVNLTSLLYLDLSVNELSSLPETLFAKLVSLEHLDLSNNDISSLPETLFAKLVSLEHLDLAYNNISSLPETLFVNLMHLTYLNIYGNALTSTPCKAIEGLQMLSNLWMNCNEFDYITCPIGNMTGLKELFVSSNREPWCRSTVQQNYTEYWNKTKWSELTTRLPTSLSTLRLQVKHKCVFQTVTNGSLLNSSVTSLELFRWASSVLSVDDDAFSMFPYLKHLKLRTSDFTERSYIYLSRYAFRGLLHLESLDLSYNNLTKIPKALEVLADSLKHLDLSYNELISTYYDNQKITFQLEWLNISSNPIREIYLTPMFSNHTYLKDLVMDGLILICPITTPIGYIHISTMANTYYYNYSTHAGCLPLCTVSSKLEGITFNKISFSDLSYYCIVWGNCSHLTSLSISESNNVFVDKQGLFPHLEQLTLTNCKLSSIEQFLLESRDLRYLDVSNNNIYNINGNDFSSLGNLYHMDLSRNQIESLPENQFSHISNLVYLNLAVNQLTNINLNVLFMNSLQTLIVSGNLLTTLPAFLMKEPYNLHHAEFGNNPFSCTCDIELLQDWILTDERTYIGPQPVYKCKSPARQENRGITSFSLDCRLHLENYIAPSVSGLIAICLISALVYKYRWRIHYKYWIFCYQRRYQRYIDNDDDADIMNSDDEDDVDADHRYEAPIMRRQYHAYVAYHRESQAWIDDQLTPNIEDGPEPFRLCMKERGDIPAGHYILNAICHGISKSRKTIVVLSENFMDDGWCHYQLQIARMRLVMDNEDVLILVQIGEIPDHKKTFLLRQILQNKEVLKWTEDPIGQELFWNKLKMELRKPARVNRRFEEV
ncbi:uncharacterized protein [Amphiura filiformis]|uniref:uncharacterized protein n=1 Tax=Amphiura filiformis TaxID=82378 RepID=UPI003B20D6E6